jgi:nicotinamide-nucleotide amidase
VRIETLCTGDELLTGLTTDTNSTTLQALLLERVGLTVRRTVVVGDVAEDLIEALEQAAARSDAVVVSGGLGPTSDDLTAECAARAAGLPLEENAEALAHVEARFAARGVTLTANNRKQALVPRGAEVVLNAEGTAPMFVLRHGECTLFFLPGVPSEFRALVQREVVPRLAALASQQVLRRVRVLRLLKTVGLPESHLDARVAPLAPQHPAVTFGYRTHGPENHLKLLAEANTEEDARAALDAASRAARRVLGDHLFGEDQDTLASVVQRLLVGREKTLAVAESCTGGLLCAALTETPGASDVFLGGAVTYCASTKRLWADVPDALLATYGAVSPEVARAMAQGVRHRACADFGLSVTGFAGPPSGREPLPVGTVFVGLAGPELDRVEAHRLHGGRERVRLFAAHSALDLLRRALQERSP